MRRNHAGNHAAGDTDDGAVHTGTVVVHQGHIAVRGAQQPRDHGGLEDQVRFNQNDIPIERKLFESQCKRMDVVGFAIACVMDEVKAIVRKFAAKVTGQFVSPIASDHGCLVDAVFNQSFEIRPIMVLPATVRRVLCVWSVRGRIRRP